MTPSTIVSYNRDLRWEFIKENKKVRKQENTLSTKKAMKKKRKKKENTLSIKKAMKKKTTAFLDRFLGRERVFVLSFFLFYFLVFLNKFSPQIWEDYVIKVKAFQQTSYPRSECTDGKLS